MLSGAPTVSTTAPVYSPGVSSTGNAGATYPVTTAAGSLGNPSGNYSFAYAPGTLTMTQAPLTVAGNNATMMYGATTLPALSASVSGYANGDDSSVVSGAPAVSTTATVYSPGVSTTGNAGATYSVTPALGNPSGNYSFVYVPGSLTMTAAPLAVSATAQSMTYGAASLPALTYSQSGLVNGDTSSVFTGALSTSATVFNGSAGTGSNVGSYPIAQNSLSAGNNYSVIYTGANLNVNPAPLTVTSSNASKTYGQSAPLAGTAFTSSGLQNSETIGSVTQTSQGAPATASLAGSPYTITPSNATGGTFTAGNYTITYADGRLTVSPALLTVTANSASKTYGQTPTLAGTAFTSSGLQNSETIGSVTQTSAGAPATANVAGSPYTITPSNASGGTFTAGNYSITYANGALTVSPAPLTVTANSASKTYGQTPVLAGTAFTASGLQNSETIASVTEISAGTAATAGVGAYAITPSSASGGTFTAGNYSITYANGALTVSPAPLTVTANSASKTYGQTLTLTGTEFTSSGLQNSETIGSVTEVSAGTAATASIAGSPYPIIPSNATGGSFTAGNYSITYANGALTVSPTALTPTTEPINVTIKDSFAPITANIPVAVLPLVTPAQPIALPLVPPPDLPPPAPAQPLVAPVVVAPAVPAPILPVAVPEQTPKETGIAAPGPATQKPYVAPLRPRKQDRN